MIYLEIKKHKKIKIKVENKMNKNVKRHAIHETRKFKKDINKKVLMQFMQKNASFYSNRDYDIVQTASKKDLNYAIKETLKQGGVYNNEYPLADTIDILIDENDYDFFNNLK